MNGIERIAAFAAVIVALIIVNLGGNLIAQKIFPTRVGDNILRRFLYRLVFLTSIGGMILIVIAIIDPSQLRIPT